MRLGSFAVVAVIVLVLLLVTGDVGRRRLRREIRRSEPYAQTAG